MSLTFESDDAVTPETPEATPVVAADEATPVVDDAKSAEAEPAVTLATEVPAGDVADDAAPAVVTEPDEALLDAHDLAYAALLEITPAATIGKPAGHIVEPDGVVSLMFETTLLGYPGWFWTVSLARVAGEEPTVLEAELLPGEKALVAPDWVPWAVRLAEYQAAQAAAAELAREDADDDADDDDSDDDLEDDDELDFDPDDMRSEGGDDLNGIDIDALGDADSDDDSDDDESDDDDDDDDESDDHDESDDDDDDDEPVAAAPPEKKRRRLSWRRLRR